MKHILYNNHTEAHRGLIKGHLPLKIIPGFAKSFKKRTKGLAFELELRTSNGKKYILHTTIGSNTLNVYYGSFFYTTTITPSSETQIVFKEAFTKSFTTSYESWTTNGNPIGTFKEFETEIS